MEPLAGSLAADLSALAASGRVRTRLRIIERSGHAPFLSHPDQVLAEVRGLLSRQPQGQVA